MKLCGTRYCNSVNAEKKSQFNKEFHFAYNLFCNIPFFIKSCKLVGKGFTRSMEPLGDPNPDIIVDVESDDSSCSCSLYCCIWRNF